MGRKLEFCREKALHTAMESFWAQGYEHTSMRDLASKLGLHLGSVYNALGDKEKVFEAALRLHYQQYVLPELETVAQANDPLAALDALMSRVIADCDKDAGKPGCFIINSLLEITSINDSISALLRQYTDKMESSFEACLANAQRIGQIPPEADIKVLSRFLMAALFSLRTLGKLKMPQDHLDDVRRCTLESLKAVPCSKAA